MSRTPLHTTSTDLECQANVNSTVGRAAFVFLPTTGAAAPYSIRAYHPPGPHYHLPCTRVGGKAPGDDVYADRLRTWTHPVP